MGDVAREAADAVVQEAVGEAEDDDVGRGGVGALGVRVGRGVGRGVGCLSLARKVSGVRGLGHAFC